jgi:hypothetical protein
MKLKNKIKPTRPRFNIYRRLKANVWNSNKTRKFKSIKWKRLRKMSSTKRLFYMLKYRPHQRLKFMYSYKTHLKRQFKDFFGAKLSDRKLKRICQKKKKKIVFILKKSFY